MNRSELVKKLELVGRALADTNLVQMFQCFVFKSNVVTAYNDTMGITSPCEVDDTFAVNGNTLLGLLRNSSGEDVTFELEDNEVLIKSGRSTFRLPYFKEEDFLFEEPTNKWPLTLPLNEGLLAGINACLLTVSRDMATQPALTGVWFRQNGSTKPITLYSCDGDAVTRYTTDTVGASQSDWFVPNDFCEAIAKIAGSDPDKKAQLQFNEDWAKARLGEYIVYGRLLEQKDPLDHEALIKDTLKVKPVFVPMPDTLDAALSRARVVADAESAKTTLTVEKARLKLITETHMGVVRDSIAFPKHPDVEALVSAELLQRTIALADEIAILDNCVVCRKGNTLLQVISNVGD